MTKKQLRKELSKFSHTIEKAPTFLSGALGIYIGGKQYVDIPNRAGYVYVRLRNNISELIAAHNSAVSPVYDLPVIVVWTNNHYEIYGRDTAAYGSYWDSSSSYLPKHGFQHEFDPANNGGGDLVFVHGEQFYPMMTFPSGTDGGNTVLIAPYRYFFNSTWHYTGNTGVGNLLTYGPTGANNAKLLLVGVTANTGNPFIKQGSEFDASVTGAAELTPYIPTSITPLDEIPGAIIRLVTGTQTITWANIYDARQYMGILQGTTGTGGATTFLDLTDTPSSYSGQADKLVVVNSAANALEFRTNTGSFGGGGGGGTLGLYGQDEAVGLGTGTVLNVVGQDISLSISGTVLTLSHSDPTGTPHNFLDLTDTPDSYSGQNSKFVAVNVGGTALEFVSSSPPGGGSGSGLVIYDDSVYKVTGTAISFDSNLSVAVTGSIAFVSSSGGGASSNSTYVLTAPDSSLPSGTIIPGLSSSADIKGVGGAGVAYEFDSGSSPLTWSTAVDTENVNSTFKSCLYIQDNGASATYGTYSWSPAGAFDIRCKVSIGNEMGSSSTATSIGLVVGNSDLTTMVFIILAFDTTVSPQWAIKAYTFATGSPTQRGNTNYTGINSIYLRIVRDGSNNNSFYYSVDGNTWTLIITQSHTYTTALAGLRLAPNSITTSVVVDWIRSNV